MSDIELQFWESFPSRLSAARKMGGHSLRGLSELIGKSVSYQTLSNWEKGKGDSLPQMQVLRAIAKALNVRIDFFFEPIRESLPQPEFRKRKSKLSKKDQAIILEKAQFALDRYLEIEEILGVSVPVINPIKKLVINSVEEAEKAADQLRIAWNLGGNSISKIVEILEEFGIRVLELDAPNSFDGLAAWAGDIPFMLINRRVEDVCRLRFTLLHELGHLFMMIPSSVDKKDIEKFCNRFASALLFPAKAFKLQLGGYRKHITLQELISLKEEWGISITAIAYRAKDLKGFSEERHRQFMINYNQAGFRKDEPGHYAMSEHPQRFRALVYRSYAEGIISESKAAYLLDVPFEKVHHDCRIVA